jgi:hypothetical protein
MSKVAAKLFREPEGARQAVGDLKAKGFKDAEIAVIANEKRAKELGPDVKSVSDVAKLTEIGVPEATVNYYRSGVSTGSIVVSVQGDDDRVAQAQELLRGAPICSCENRICGTSPGFQVASRMSATNPVDAPMSGDFRRY